MSEQISIDDVSIVSVDCYNKEYITTLEQQVEAMLQDGSYNFGPLKATLRLYLFYPELTKVELVAAIFAKTLTQLPATDYLLCTYLVPEPLRASEPVKTIQTLADSLEKGEFQKFWSQVEENKSILQKIVGFEKSIRDYISSLLVLTYESVSIKALSSALNLTGQELDQFMQEKGGKKENDSVELPMEKEKLRLKKGVDLNYGKMQRFISSAVN